MRRAKIVVPPRPPRFIDRPGLREHLDEQSRPPERGRVILVSAPVGHGKTAAVADWVAARSEVPTAWATLDASDREEATWWATVLGALEALPADGGRDRRGGAGSSTALAATVLDVLEGLEQHVHLVLDDVHEIVGHPAFDGLVELLRHPLPQVTVLLCSRLDPPLGLDRLRLHGRLGQMRVDELTFSDEDAARLFRREALDLSDDQVATLVDRTEGWVAALRLVALSLRDARDPAEFVDEFAGDDRSVADYLVGEVLSRVGDDELEVLQAASVASPLPQGLAVALSGREDAVEILDRLEATTAMVTATDRRREYYRTHELLRSHVLARLRRRRPARLVELHRRAATWYDAQGEHLEALRCAGAAGDVETVAALLRARAVELVGRGEFSALAASGRTSTAAMDDPRVRLLLGLAAVESGDLELGVALVDAAEEELAGSASGHDGDVAVLRRIVAVRVAVAAGRIDEAVTLAGTLRPEAVEDAPLRTLALVTRGGGLVATRPRQAHADCTEALAVATARGWSYLAMQARTTLGVAHLWGGDRATTTAHARAVVEGAARHGWARNAWLSRAHLVLASADLLQGEATAALGHVERAEAAGATGHRQVAYALETVRGAAELDVERGTQGWQRMRRARLDAEGVVLPAHQIAFAGLLEQHAALRLGHVREAAAVVRALGPRLAGTAEAEVLRARQGWAVDRDPAVRDHLLEVLARRRRLLTSLGIVEALLLDAEIAVVRSELPIAHQRMLRALRLGRRFGVVRPLLDLPSELHEYLAAQRGSFGDLDVLVDRLLADAPVRRPELRALTLREADVLAHLPTMRSATEIADDLAVSVNTVKTHQRAIYQKLGAANRREAVTRARDVGLLGPDH